MRTHDILATAFSSHKCLFYHGRITNVQQENNCLKRLKNHVFVETGNKT